MALSTGALAQSSFTPTSTKPPRVRIESVDVLRGVIMILMALDHTRDFFGDATASPTNLATASAALFMTRWVTHFCAPVFFLLTGTGSFLAGRRRGVRGLSRFLLTRGLWLIFVELVIFRCFALQFNFDYLLTVLTVLWALGWSMVVLAALVHLPVRVITAIGIAFVVVHNAFDQVQASALGAFGPLWTVLHAPGVLFTNGTRMIFVAYPLVPWIGVTAIGYGLGQLYDWDAGRRRAFLLRLGIALTVAFVLLRAVNVYGDPNRWAPQHSALFTVLSFMNTTKYPPSLLFLLMTLGPAMLFLRAVDGRTPEWLRPALIIGKVPMFYYVLHFALIHLLAVIAALLRYGDVRGMFQSPTLDRFPITQPPGWPLPLPAVWLIWISVPVMLYPLCKWFAAVKQRRSDWWLSYL
ncbi:MAG: DUF1624 domain-containing protein [Gemmatimonadaceae bacterium]